MSQLLPPVVPTVHPAAEAHQHHPGGHAQARDEGRLPDDAGDLLRYALVASRLPRGRGPVCRHGYKKRGLTRGFDSIHLYLNSVCYDRECLWRLGAWPLGSSKEKSLLRGRNLEQDQVGMLLIPPTTTDC